MNTRNAAERLPRFGREMWEPYLADTLLRVFASCGISGQLGNFTRPFLDFTQGSVRLLILNCPSGQLPYRQRGKVSVICPASRRVDQPVQYQGCESEVHRHSLMMRVKIAHSVGLRDCMVAVGEVRSGPHITSSAVDGEGRQWPEQREPAASLRGRH